MTDTIVAVSTTMGVGAVSIIRLSGKDSIKIVNEVFSGKDLTKVETHTVHYGFIKEKEELIDEVLITVMKAPKSFTTEDVVEINCHGGIATTNKVLEIILKKGARLAEPGEFTKRAFINGRIDLVEAESVLELINANNEHNRRASLNQLNGKISNLIKQFRQELLELIASIEVNIDYPEYEDIEIITNQNIKDKIDEIAKKLGNIVKESENSKIIKHGINVAIVGRPNVGKSSLLNKLINEDKAIVTEIEGTTRDLVEGSTHIEEIPINFIDTAGVRETNDKVEKIGIDRTLETIDKADLVLLLLASNEELTAEDYQLLEKTSAKNRIIVINKNDLKQKIQLNVFGDEKVLLINTKDDNEIDKVKNEIKSMFMLEKINHSDYKIFGTVRQISLAKEALSYIDDIKKGLENNVPTDLIEIDIKKIWSKLGEIIGETYTDELLDQLFSQFCLGK